jgi:hypothetical protein
MHNKIIKSFTDHPKSIGETYWQHFSFAFNVSLGCLLISALAFIHAIFPFLFVTAASDRLERISKAIQDRGQHEKKSLNCCSS